MTPVNELVERLRRRVQPKEKTIANSRSTDMYVSYAYHFIVQAQQVDDDEVQAGPTKLSLRDPVRRLLLHC